jgi:malonyl-CoA/methylmalonyl-CoA synthetase
MSDLGPALFPALGDDPPDRIAISFPDRSLTYAELRAAAARVAGSLAGVSRAAVLAESRIETCLAVIAALGAGVPIVPINPKSGDRELAHIVGDAEPEALLIAPGTPVPNAFAGCRTLVVDLSADAAGALALADSPSEPAGGPEAPALIVYTSGTTGAPKGAVLPRRAIASNLDALAEAWAWDEHDAVAHALPLFHVHGLVIGILGPVRRGGRAVHIGRFSAEGVQLAFEQGATVLFGVPTMYRRLADAAQASPPLAAALRGARLLVSGSAALPASEHERLRRLIGRAVVERYGMTETLMNTAVRVGGEARPGSVGPPLAGVELRLVDDDRTPIQSSDGEAIGEIEVRGPNLFLGYLNRDDATAAAMHDGWFATGDMATRDRDGHIRIVGRRATDLIKSGGYKIGAGEIEASLRDHPAIDDAAVTGEPDPDLGERVVAWVTLRTGAGAEAQELIDHVAGQLAPHKRPRVIHFLAELPRNELGKVQKKRLTAE